MNIDPKRFRVGPDAEVSDIDLATEEFTLRDGTRLTDERAAELVASKRGATDRRRDDSSK